MREAFRFERHEIDMRSGVAGAVATVAPLAVGVIVGETFAGLIGTVSGLNAALAVPRADLRSRLFWGALAGVAMGVALLLADVVSDTTWLLLIATFVWVGACGLLRGAGRDAMLAGFVITAVFIILGGLPDNPTPLSTRLAWYAGGASAGVALMVLARAGSAGSRHAVRDALAALPAAVVRDRNLQGHVLRLAVAITIATALYRALGLAHGYWVPITVLVILQPQERATDVRAIQRLAGTLVGVALVAAITIATQSTWPLLACTMVAAFWLFALIEPGYFWMVVVITPTALLMMGAVGLPGDVVGAERALNSFLGIICGFVIGELAWRIGRLRRVAG